MNQSVIYNTKITSFQCSGQQWPGYYADMEANCQVFHICQADGRQDAFLCPNGTIFSQMNLVCVYWWQFDCSSAQSLYELNMDLYNMVDVNQCLDGNCVGMNGAGGGMMVNMGDLGGDTLVNEMLPPGGDAIMNGGGEVMMMNDVGGDAMMGHGMTNGAGDGTVGGTVGGGGEVDTGITGNGMVGEAEGGIRGGGNGVFTEDVGIEEMNGNGIPLDQNGGGGTRFFVDQQLEGGRLPMGPVDQVDIERGYEPRTRVRRTSYGLFGL